MSHPREEWSRLTTLLDTAAVAVSGCGVPTTRVGVVHGDLVWDECCSGYLFTRVVRTTVGTSFPQPSQDPRNCPKIPTTLVELGILRCAPVIDDNGNPPSAEEQSDFAKAMIVDKSILYNVIINHKPSWASFPLVIENWVPLSIEGGCGGGAWQFYMDVVLCECGPE